MFRLLFGALLGALLLPFAASGGTSTLPAPGTVLGGGYQPANLSSPGLTMLALSVVDAKHVAVWVAPFVSGCAGQPVVFHAALAADGSFKGVYRNGYDKASGAYADGGGPVTYAGRFASPTKATGTIRLVWAEGANDCRTDTISWAASTKSSSSSGAAAPSALYTGTTSQKSKLAPVNLPLMVRVSADGKTAAATAYLNTFCADAPALNISSGGFFAGPGMKIGADSSFHELGRFYATVGTRKVAYTSTFTGRFGAGAVSGTWTMDALVTAKATGKKIASCTSGSLTWRAVR